MSILSAGTTNSTALNLTADTSGSLILASNNNVTAVTIHANQNATFANTATFPTTIGIGGATPSANGSGITFPATQSASSDANTLDDYEEGTFTPTVTASGSIASFTYVAQLANYVKIGKTVYFSLNAEITSLAGGSSGNLRISNLPFTVSATSGYAAVAMGYIGQTGGTAPNGGLAVSNATYIQFYNNSGGSVTAIGFGALSAFNYHLAGTYTTT